MTKGRRHVDGPLLWTSPWLCKGDEVDDRGARSLRSKSCERPRSCRSKDFKPPKQKISDPAELAEYRLRKRKEFEDLVRRVRWNQSVWVKVSRCSFRLSWVSKALTAGLYATLEEVQVQACNSTAVSDSRRATVWTTNMALRLLCKDVMV